MVNVRRYIHEFYLLAKSVGTSGAHNLMRVCMRLNVMKVAYLDALQALQAVINLTIMSKLTFAILFSLLVHTLQGQTATKIFTTDIDNFWNAYDSVQTIKDTTKQAQFIQQLYLDKATDGLKDFMVTRRHSAQRHLNNILKNPKFWVSVRPHTLQIKSYTTDIEEVMLRFKKLYGSFKQPTVYFTIGCLNSGGTISDGKILIGSEIATADSSVDASELGPWLQGVFKSNNSVVSAVAHEVGHTQQNLDEAEADSTLHLLGWCIQEGVCDFIAELLLQKPIKSGYMTYGKANEKEVWKIFEKEMNGHNIKDWLYNSGKAPSGCADLGYFVGYIICKSYYENSKNKKHALKEIIELQYTNESILKFLETSRYQDKWK